MTDAPLPAEATTAAEPAAPRMRESQQVVFATEQELRDHLHRCRRDRVRPARRVTVAGRRFKIKNPKAYTRPHNPESQADLDAIARANERRMRRAAKRLGGVRPATEASDASQ